MQLTMNIPTLLASIILALTFSVDARPMSKRNDGMIHLPLKRLHSLARTDVHPLVLFQQHVNRAHRRIARMTGTQEPSDLVLRDNIERRMFLLPGGGLKNAQAQGTNAGENKRYVATGQVASELERIRAGALLARKHRGGKKIAAGAAAGAAVGAGAGAAAAGAAGSGAGSNGTGAGFSEVDLNAAVNGGLTKSVVTTSNGTTGLDIEANDVGYISTVQIGTPPTDFRVLMDSGSADFWVAATTCVQTGNIPCSAKHQSLGTASSSSFVDTQKPFQVTYGSGAVAGTIITDDVTLADLTLNTHTFGASSQETVQFGDDSVDFDGLMGLAQSTLSNQQVLTPVESLAKQGSIASAITSFKISRLADGKNDGQVTFGGLDQTKFDPATLITIPNVSKTGFWEGAVDAVTVDGKDLGLSGRTAILDTGTTLIIAPAADAAAVHAAIPGSASDGQGGFTIPCTSTTSVALTFGKQSFAIDARDLAFLPVDQNDLTGDCTSGLSSGTIGGPEEWLVGDVFLKNAYFSTDVTQNTVSLAKLV